MPDQLTDPVTGPICKRLFHHRNRFKRHCILGACSNFNEETQSCNDNLVPDLLKEISAGGGTAYDDTALMEVLTGIAAGLATLTSNVGVLACLESIDEKLFYMLEALNSIDSKTPEPE